MVGVKRLTLKVALVDLGRLEQTRGLKEGGAERGAPTKGSYILPAPPINQNSELLLLPSHPSHMIMKLIIHNARAFNVVVQQMLSDILACWRHNKSLDVFFCRSTCFTLFV